MRQGDEEARISVGREADNGIRRHAFSQLFHLKRSQIDLSHHIGLTCLRNRKIESVVEEFDKPGRFHNNSFV
jgi:hypothetical protein